MITVRQHEKLIDKISKLSELELDELLHDVAFLLTKNNWNHLADSAFLLENHQEMIDDLEERIERHEQKIDELETDNMGMEGKIEDAIDELEDLDYDGEDSLTDKSKIKDIIKSLQS